MVINSTYVAWSWRAGGSKNTFNIDDVGYANASDVNMNVGALNSSLYNSEPELGALTSQHQAHNMEVMSGLMFLITSVITHKILVTGVYGPNYKWTFTNPVSVSSYSRVSCLGYWHRYIK